MNCRPPDCITFGANAAARLDAGLRTLIASLFNAITFDTMRHLSAIAMLARVGLIPHPLRCLKQSMRPILRTQLP